MSHDYSPAVPAPHLAERPTATRMTITAEFSDGTTVTVTKDSPADAELEITLTPQYPDLRGGPDVFRVMPPRDLIGVSVKFRGAWDRPVEVAITAASRYDCEAPGCPSPHMKAAITDILAHMQAHQLIRQWRQAGVGL